MKNATQSKDVLPHYQVVLGNAGVSRSCASSSGYTRGKHSLQRQVRSQVQLGNEVGDSRGFSLLEILVACTILAIGFIALVRIFPIALLQTQIVAERTEVSSLARSRAGMLRSSGVGDAFDKWAKDNMMKALTDSERAYALYTGWTSSVQRMGGLTPLYRVTFTVQMLDGGEESFVTYVTEL